MSDMVRREYKNSGFIYLFDQEYAVNQYGKAQRAEGERIGEERGEKKGEYNERLSNIRRAMKKQNMDLQEAMDYMDIPKEDQPRYAMMLKEEPKGFTE